MRGPARPQVPRLSKSARAADRAPPRRASARLLHCLAWNDTRSSVKIVNTIGTLLFWLLSPALIVLMAGPLFIGHVVTRLLIARMPRRRGDVRDSEQAPRLP